MVYIPFPNFHTARIVDPNKFTQSSFRTITFGKETEGILAVIGRLKNETSTTVQAFRFDKNKFTPEQARKWLKDHNYTIMLFEESIDNIIEFTNTADFAGTHSVTIQRLGTWIPFANTSQVPGGKVYYDVENFSETEENWNNKPIIFIPEGKIAKHPNHESISKDAESGAKEVGGYVAGYLTNTTILKGDEGQGEPRAISDAVFTCEKVNNLANQGKLSCSTGFNANVNPNGLMSGKVIPNHLLVFVRNSCPTCFANDNGATFNNTIEENKMDEESKGFLKSISENLTKMLEKKPEKIDNVIENSDAGDTVKDTTEFDNLKVEFDNVTVKFEEANKTIESLKESETGLKTELDNIKADNAKKDADAKWTAFKNAASLPKAWMDVEAETRAKYDADPTGFMIELMNFKNTVETKEAEGKTSVNNAVEEDWGTLDIGKKE